MTKTDEDWTYGDPCQCGCGGKPKGARSRFLPGHDARMHGHTAEVNARARAIVAKPKAAPVEIKLTRVEWTHKQAQRESHVMLIRAIRVGGRLVCSQCGNAVRRLGKDEGPESLRSLLSF